MNSIYRKLILGITDLHLVGLAFFIGISSFVLMQYLKIKTQLGLPVVILLVCAFYLLIRKRLPSFENQLSNFSYSANSLPWFTTPLLVSIFSVVAYTTIFQAVDVIKRPVWLFLLISLLPVILWAQEKYLQRSVLLVEITILVIAVVFTNMFVFPFDGGDIWIHINNASILKNQYHVQQIWDAYKDFPLYPAFIGVTAQLTNLDMGLIARGMGVLVAVLSVWLVFAIAEKFFNSTYALVTSLVLLGSKWFIVWITRAVSMSAGIVFVVLLVLLLANRVYKKVNIKEAFLLIVLVAITPFFHPVISFITILIIAAYFAFEEVIKQRMTNLLRNPSLYVALILSIVIVLAQWIFYGRVIFERQVNSLVGFIFVDGSLQLSVTSENRGLIDTLFDEFNFYLLLALTGLEFLHQFRCQTKRENLILAGVGFSIVVFGMVTMLFGISAMLPDRWFLFGTIALVFPASHMLMKLSNQWQYKRFFLAIFLFVYFLTGLVNNQVNKDNPLFGKSVSGRMRLTYAEMNGLKYVENFMMNEDLPLVTDSWLADYLKFSEKITNLQFWHYKYNPVKLEGFNGVFPKRQEYFITQNVGFSRMTPFAEEFRNEIENTSQFYDNGDIQWLYHLQIKDPTIHK